MSEVVCVNCGESNLSIYKQFNDEIIKLTTCVKCNEVVDKYAETENSIIILDMLLLRKEALRHVIFNSKFKVAWKLIVLFILSDAYKRIASTKRISLSDNFKPESYINELELNFYLMCLKSFLEYFIFSSLTVIVLYYSQTRSTKKNKYYSLPDFNSSLKVTTFPLNNHWLSRKRLEWFSHKNLFHSIVIASYGKLFMLPVLVWSKDEEYCQALILLFIFLSQIQVIRVTTNLSSMTIVIMLVVITKVSNVILQYLI